MRNMLNASEPTIAETPKVDLLLKVEKNESIKYWIEWRKE